MSVVAMESQCMKTIMIHLVGKSDFMPSDHKTHCKSLQQFQLNLAKSENCDFSCIKLALQKVWVNHKYNLAKTLAPYFVSWCASLNKLYHFHPRMIEGIGDLWHF